MTTNSPIPPTMEELLPCPWCGSEAELVHDTSSDYSQHWDYCVCCKNWKGEPSCGASSPSGKTAQAAITLWNTRTPDPLVKHLQQQVVELTDEVENLRDIIRYERDQFDKERNELHNRFGMEVANLRRFNDHLIKLHADIALILPPKPMIANGQALAKDEKEIL